MQEPKETEEIVNQLLNDLFRKESGKMISVMTRIFGSENLDLAEDVVQDAMLEAMKNWEEQGIPDNPAGWLYRVARNKALNIVNRNKYQRQYTSDVLHYLKSPWTVEPAGDILFSEEEIVDDQLRMMFTCCHPVISADSQVALILKTLCGFTIPEIAKAFITSRDSINKRLVRARKKIREDKIPFEVPRGSELISRSEAVLEAIYLMFNEGYSASSGNDLIRYELCEEAMRLTELLLSHSAIKDKSDSYALLALMQLNASRFKSRQDKDGNILTLELQDRSQWDFSLMEKGFENLKKSTIEGQISFYHILASISACHCAAKDFESTDWKSILSQYDRLLQLGESPVILLNRAIVVSKVSGIEAAIGELEKVSDALQGNHLFHSTKAEFYIQLGKFNLAKYALRDAIELTAVPVEKKLLQDRLNYCKQNIFGK